MNNVCFELPLIQFGIAYSAQFVRHQHRVNCCDKDSYVWNSLLRFWTRNFPSLPMVPIMKMIKCNDKNIILVRHVIIQIRLNILI